MNIYEIVLVVCSFASACVTFLIYSLLRRHLL